MPYALVLMMVVVALLIVALRLERVVVYDYQRGVLYRRGRRIGTLGPAPAGSSAEYRR